MAFVIADRVAETTTTTGTGTLNLAGATTGFQSFVSGVGTGNTTYYVITDNTDWEVGIGTVTSGSPDTLSRDTVLQSTNSDAAVNWGAGTKDVFLSMPADRVVLGEGDNTFTGGNNFTGASDFSAGTMTLPGDTISLIKRIALSSKSTAYTGVIGDANSALLHPSADTTARTFTIPANASVAYPIGTTLTFVNQNAAGVLTIAITSDTMRLAGEGTTGSRTLAANGVATAYKITSTEWIISGVGLE